MEESYHETPVFSTMQPCQMPQLTVAFLILYSFQPMFMVQINRYAFVKIKEKQKRRTAY